ncbi:cytochrome c oxidase assembly protein [Kutzneria buriramensis]|uniref:Cytochrome c oxidase assembly factor CtaG n=1 Tax=Kutzneria buriramensis TaxID=1045776 RepID=A0A3E0HAG1_9PSEU|nr:cytochrome c oxidase assembly protein [Kutzneria buriramensis]REH41023.1 cytochrome c oxidase assembly factor CtaG [Kutzneria buriramensis]
MSEPLTLVTAVTSWTADPVSLLVIVVLGGWYGWAVRRVGAWPRARVVAFYAAGLGSYVIATLSSIGAYADTLFSMRAAQIILLLMVTPLGLALGAPFTLLRDTAPTPVVARLRSVLHSPFGKVIAFPATASALLIGTPWALYFTGWYPAVLRSSVIDELTRLTLLLIGLVYFWSRLQLDPVPRRFHHLVSVWITLAEVVGDAALGLTLWFSGHIVAQDYYQALGRGWGPDLRLDQTFGAGVLWIVGDLAGLPFLGALVNRMTKEDAKQAEEIDQVLDEREAAGEDTDRPWWESDPTLSERFRRR